MVIEHGHVPTVIRSDAGTENVVVGVLRCDHSDVRDGGNCYIIGCYTGNRRIETFWSVLKRGFTAKWINTFRDLEQIGLFNPADTENIRMWFTLILQNEPDHVKMYWTSTG